MPTFLIARLSSSRPCWTRTQLGLLLPNASRIPYSFSSVVKSSESNQPAPNREGNQSFTVSYLVNSCGLSAKAAREVSRRVELKHPGKPDSVLHLFRSYGFSGTQISKVVKFYPRVLLAKLANNLLPKLSFLLSIGFSASEIPEVLTSNTLLLHGSLEKRIIPHYEALKSVLVDDWKVRICLKCPTWNFSYHGATNIVPNMKVLRDEGVPQSSVFSLLSRSPNVACMKQSQFVEYVKSVKEIGIEPHKVAFVDALTVLANLKKSTWELKLDIFERCGWSRNVTLLAFRKFPRCMLISEEKVTNLMKFLVDEMGLRLEDIAGCPTILSYSLKQRIVPRWSVVKVLKIKGLIKNNISMPTVIITSEKRFLENFVSKFQDSVPQLVKVYRGELRPLPEILV